MIADGNWALTLARPEVRSLPELALDDAAEDALTCATRLHANENAYACSEPALHHYPHMYARTAEHAMAALYGIHVDSLCVTRGSDEGIDLLVRTFCRPAKDAVLVFPPTFGMYGHAARVQGCELHTVALTAPDFALPADRVQSAITGATKLVFFCVPNNPTGCGVTESLILDAAARMAGKGLVVVDEAYLEFSGRESMARHLQRVSNMVVLRTLSKARGLAGARVGTLIAHPDVIALLRRIRLPYGIASHSMSMAVEAATPAAQERSAIAVACIMQERARIFEALSGLPGVERVWPSEANFHLIRHEQPERVVAECARAGIALRAFSDASPGLERCLRITLGTPEQNDRLLTCMGQARGAA